MALDYCAKSHFRDFDIFSGKLFFSQGPEKDLGAPPPDGPVGIHRDSTASPNPRMYGLGTRN